MLINAIKSRCMRVGPRCDVPCANVTTICGKQLPWVKELCYLSVYIVQSRHFKCDAHENKKSFFAHQMQFLAKLDASQAKKFNYSATFFEVHTNVVIWP